MAQRLVVPTIETARLKLTALSAEHSLGMFALWSNELVTRYSGTVSDYAGVEIPMPATSVQESDRIVDFWTSAARDGWGFRWAVIRGEDAAFVGTIGFNSLLKRSELAYHQVPDYWGNGYMLEAAGAAVQWLSARGDCAELEAFIEPENAGSIALARSLGLEPQKVFSEGAERYAKAL